jgi:hypothetical protein
MVTFGIHGSCVTRDMFAVLRKESLIGFYQARSSICTKGPARDVIDSSWVDSLESQFQRRMVRWDLQRNVLPLSSVDALIIDLIDERFDVLRCGRELLTGSKQFLDAGGTKMLETEIAFHQNSEERLAAFAKGCEYIGAIARDHEVPILFHNSRWAKHYRNTNGQLLEFENQGLIAGSNRRLSRMSEVVRSVLNPVLEINIEEQFLVGDTQHTWGVSPYHFVPEYYHKMWDILSEFVSRWSPE